MNEPLGQAVGNALEVQEAISILKGEPADADLVEVTMALAAEMLVLAGASRDVGAAKGRLEEALRSGAADARCRSVPRLAR